jgi:hypothetical protein
MLRRTNRAFAFIAPLLAAFALGCGERVSPLPDRDAYVAGETIALSCAPNLDGVLTASELPTVYGTPVTYLENPAGQNRAVDLVGDGTSWNFGTDYATDQDLSISVDHLAGKWYAGSYPSGQFVTAQDAAHTLDAIYRRDDSGVYLLGIASASEKPAEGQTLLVYDNPILVAKFPLQPGMSWVSAGNVTNGTIRGLPYAGKDVYEVTDDATGTLVLHDYTFQQVHRVRTKVTASPSAGAPVVKRQVSFFFECFGEVTRVVSQDNEPNDNFTVATELRRFGQ